MQLTARLCTALILSVAAVSLGFAFFQTRASTLGLQHDLERHALVLGDSLAKSAEPLLENHSYALPLRNDSSVIGALAIFHDATYIDRQAAALMAPRRLRRIRQLPIPQYLFYPSIDPMADKNRELEPAYVAGVLEKFGIYRTRPILTQISRFDRLKYPTGVVRAYQLVKRYVDCQLVLARGGATDDPEGAEVLAKVIEAAAGDPDIHVSWNFPLRKLHESTEFCSLQRSFNNFFFGAVLVEKIAQDSRTIFRIIVDRVLGGRVP